ACLVPDVAPGHEPRVRVTDSLDGVAPGARPAASAAAGSGGPGKGGRGAGGLPPEVSALPARLRGKRVVAVEELDAGMRRRAAGRGDPERPLTPADVSVQFAAEDGSDRTAWGRPRDCLVHPSGASDDPADRVLRGVLGRWDFTQPDGWEPLFAQEL